MRGSRSGLGSGGAPGRMGAHGPPTNRSFYLSMAASTLRFAIVVALVVGGIVVINQAFPSAPGGGTGPIGDGAVATSPPTTTTPPPEETPEETVPSPVVEGIRIAVFNGTSVTGLAGDVTDQLTEQGYVAIEPADAPSPVAVTTVYYRKNKDKIEAEYLANTFFKKLDDVRVAKLQAGSDVDPDVQVAIFLGNDYAALKG